MGNFTGKNSGFSWAFDGPTMGYKENIWEYNNIKQPMNINDVDHFGEPSTSFFFWCVCKDDQQYHMCVSENSDSLPSGHLNRNHWWLNQLMKWDTHDPHNGRL